MTAMKRLSTFALSVAFPSSLLLIYLAMHATEGWQLLVVGAFFGCFVASWMKHSKIILSATYAMTIALAAWVASVNL
jgi:hypothetical protein